MESVLSLFIFHDTYVISALVVGITVIVVLLLLFNQKSPKALVDSEFEAPERIEGALRRVLGEQNWQAAGSAPDGAGASQKLQELEKELLEKDQAIANLNKQITQGGGASGGSGDNSDLANKIAELEARLMEYEIIEDDIADLSLYKTENEKLKAELERLKALAGQPEEASGVEPSAEASEVVVENAEAPPVSEEPVEQAAASAEPTEPPSDGPKDMGADLVAEFEKVVSSQEMLGEEGVDDGNVEVQEEQDSGKVIVNDEKTEVGQVKRVARNDDPEVHPKLRTVSPDSKEEAEVFVSELKELQKGLKK